VGALDGKVAIVTGAGGGIGRCHALLLATEGAQLVVNDLGGSWDGEGHDARAAQQVVEEIEAIGGTAVANHDSCSDWNAAEAMIQQAIDTFGSVDILVNNAGILRDKMGYNMTESDWDSVINVHLKGHFATTHFAAKHWRERARAGDEIYGRIINTASESGMFGNAGQANYAAAKAGIIALTQVTARELA
jgi:NAD(P)-dependent dehydrogenase (short-subunit alcohol dehydrogenase family)